MKVRELIKALQMTNPERIVMLDTWDGKTPIGRVLEEYTDWVVFYEAEDDDSVWEEHFT